MLLLSGLSGRPGAVDVRVQHANTCAQLLQRDGQIDRGGRLAHAALAGADRDDIADAGMWRQSLLDLAGMGTAGRTVHNEHRRSQGDNPTSYKLDVT